MNKTYFDIQCFVLQSISIAKKINDSLVKEFDFLDEKFNDSKILKAKKKQIDLMDSFIKNQNELYDVLGQLDELHTKTEFCLINYGVSYLEYQLFVNNPLNYIIEMATKRKKENSVQLPIIFKHVFDYTELIPEEKKIEYSDKPVFSLEKLKTMAKENPGILKKAINP